MGSVHSDSDRQLADCLSKTAECWPLRLIQTSSPQRTSISARAGLGITPAHNTPNEHRAKVSGRPTQHETECSRTKQNCTIRLIGLKG